MAAKVEETGEISCSEDKIKILFIFRGNDLHCQDELLLNDLGYGSVYRGVWKGKPVSIRQVPKSHCFPNWKENFDRHVKGTLNSDNVLKVLGFEEDSSLRYFALELFGGTLEQYCNRQYNGPMPFDAQVLYQIAKGVAYLHKRGLAHGRLNPKAILICQSHPVKMKVSDFGLCQFKDASSDCDAINMKESLPIAGNVQEDLTHPKYWINSRLPRKLKEPTESGDTFSIPAPTVHGDTFATGCLFFYFLERGLHPFGDTASILNNISRMNSINLKKLDKTHFAFDSIEKLIQDPPTDGTQLLSIALVKFKDVLPLRIDENKIYGQGAYGIVYAGRYDGKPVAVKRLSRDVYVSESTKREMKREVKGHSQMDHENVLKLLHIDEEKHSSFIYLVLELCAGTLTNFCEKKYQGPPLPQDELVLYQIANGLHYIHSSGLVHRDVKPDNILISMTSPPTIKLSDFGLCKKVSHQETFSQSALKGTRDWMAPEMLEIMNDSENEKNELPHGTIESDTFSAGCVFFYFLTRGSHPFGNSHSAPANILQNKPVEIVSYIQSLQKEKEGKLELYNVIKNMITKKDERIALSNVLAHLTSLLTAYRQFKEIERAIPGSTSYWQVCRFNPTKPVLACSLKYKVIFFTAPDAVIPFSNWKQSELKLQAQNGNDISALQWNPNGNQLAAGCRNGDVIVCNYPTGEIIFQMNQHSRMVSIIEWNPSRLDMLASIDNMGTKCLLWTSPSDSMTNQIRTIEGEGVITCAKWISENQIALGFRYGVIGIWEILSNPTSARCTTFIRDVDFHDSIEDLHWNENAKYLVSWSRYGEIKIWSTDREESIYGNDDFICTSFTWRPHRTVTGEIELSRSLNYACGTRDGNIFIWNPLKNEGKPQILSRQHATELVLVVFSSDGQFLTSADVNDLETCFHHAKSGCVCTEVVVVVYNFIRG
ncbi:uncharacterized protein LOC130692784 isoform X2 [Daphnia carinata]|uniref:uncharacterized protein LOC130692784 isoform X2 n=1 Tax=Daphnia carinata TaxID=120202 RepID=UPI00257D6415|nr:uncharacterized protein LOC130692784 isoform X2 [Daphnia carinata]